MNPQLVFAELEAIRVETLERLENLSQSQLDARPPESENEQLWSLGEVFMHIAIDEVYLRELIARPLQEGTKPPEGITFLPPPPPHGTPKDVIRFWLARSRSQTRVFVEEWPEEWYPELKHEGGLELMNALEWLEGYGGHEAFHHRQLDALIQWCLENGVT
jgi:hypothetical protein